MNALPRRRPGLWTRIRIRMARRLRLIANWVSPDNF